MNDQRNGKPERQICLSLSLSRSLVELRRKYARLFVHARSGLRALNARAPFARKLRESLLVAQLTPLLSALASTSTVSTVSAVRGGGSQGRRLRLQEETLWVAVEQNISPLLTFPFVQGRPMFAHGQRTVRTRARSAWKVQNVGTTLTIVQKAPP